MVMFYGMRQQILLKNKILLNKLDLIWSLVGSLPNLVTTYKKYFKRTRIESCPSPYCLI